MKQDDIGSLDVLRPYDGDGLGMIEHQTLRVGFKVRRVPFPFFSMVIRAARHETRAARRAIGPVVAGGGGQRPFGPADGGPGCRERRVSLPGSVERGRSASFVQRKAASGWWERGERRLPSRGAGECGTTPCPGWRPLAGLGGQRVSRAPRSGAGVRGR